MGTDYYYLLDDAEEADRFSFITSEMEKLRQMAAIYNGMDEIAYMDDE